MGNFIGRFYFKRTKTGNLIGEYSNSEMTEVRTESSNAISESQSFVGKYQSIWSDGTDSTSAILSINYKPHTNNRIYSLEWTNSSGKILYKGEGMLVDDILIGDYRNY